MTVPRSPDLAALLSQVPLFASLPDEARQTLAARMRRRRLPPATPILYRDDPAGAMYVIVGGRVKVHSATRNGDEVILAVLGAGAFFGEMSLLDGEARAADVSTLEPTEVAILEGAALHELVAAQPDVAWALLSALSRRVREQNRQMEMLMTRDVAGRVAALLLNLSGTQGRPAPDGRGVRIEASLTQSDIASFVGATRERVSRALSGFRSQGAIFWDGAHWVVLKPDVLTRRAEL